MCLSSCRRRWAQHKTRLASSGVGFGDSDQRGVGSASREQLGGSWFQEGWATLVSFYHAEKDVKLVVHDKDFTCTGDEAALKLAAELMNVW